MPNELKIENLSFKYSNKQILENLNFSCSYGVNALLGHNGAGKTTLMKLLTKLNSIQSGNIYFNDKNIYEKDVVVQNFMGYLPQNFELYKGVKGYDFLSYVYDVKGLDKSKKKAELDQIISQFNLQSVINKNFNSYSGGYKRRLGIAQAMIGNPKIIVIDEPTVGLDPEQRFEFRKYLSKISRDKIVVISTHIIEDVEFFCDKVIIIKEGVVQYDGTRDQLIDSIKDKVYEGEVDISEYELLNKNAYIVEEKRTHPNKFKIRILSDTPINEKLKKVEGTLEDGYLYYQRK